MPYRLIPFVNGEYYHIFNRGVDHMPIFSKKQNFKRFLKTMLYYQLKGPKPSFSVFTPTTLDLSSNDRIIEIICYCLMPNHFHFLLKQSADGGITEFISKLSNSYTKYFNVLGHRVGPLLQGEFKAVLVENNEQLLHLSRYIHLNPLVSGITNNLEEYSWSSYIEYLGLTESGICSKGIVLDQFRTSDDYKKFVLDQQAYGRDLEFIKHQVLDL